MINSLILSILLMFCSYNQIFPFSTVPRSGLTYKSSLLKFFFGGPKVVSLFFILCRASQRTACGELPFQMATQVRTLSAVSWGNVGFEPWTAGQQRGGPLNEPSFLSLLNYKVNERSLLLRDSVKPSQHCNRYVIDNG
jgi:hypothetical protein